jgi:MoaA/NifB/PqqE/SkfB family radical SAM enzyme
MSKADLTVFLITTGEPSTPTCLRRLYNQDCEFTLEIIHDVAPLNVAFQQMIDRCQTDYYVQVDADMLLNPRAIRTVYEGLKSQSEKTAIYISWLWGDAEDRPIVGLKCYRLSLMRSTPYRSDVMSCEVPQVKDLESRGYRTFLSDVPHDRDGCVGLHYSLQTPEMAFRRWQRLMHKHRRYPWMAWVADYPRVLELRWREVPTPINQAAYLGAIAGLVGTSAEEREIDFREANQDYRRIASYVGEFSDGPTELIVYPTSRCNLKCEFCLRQESGVRKFADIAPLTVEKMIDRFPTIRECSIGGFGEPLLHPGLSGVMGVLLKRGIRFSLFTNGVLLQKRVDEIALSHPVFVNVSLNSSTREEYALMTRVDQFDAVLSGIRACVRAGVETAVSFVITRRNAAKIREFIDLSVLLGARHVRLFSLLPHGGHESRYFRANAIIEGSDEAHEIEKARELTNSSIVDLWPVPIVFDSPTPLRCASPFRVIGVDGDGSITGCRRCAGPSSDNGRVEHIDWRGQYFSALRLCQTGDRKLPAVCLACSGLWCG